MSGKYVIFDWPGKGEIPVIFPAGIFHHDIATSINGKFPGVEPVRAGFVELRDEAPKMTMHVDLVQERQVRCYGGSQALNLHSDFYIDSLLIETMIKE